MKRHLIIIYTAVTFLLLHPALPCAKMLPGGHFLNLELGARPAAMGGAFTGISDDINSLYWNPAGLGKIDYQQACAMYSRWLEGTSYGYLGYVFPWSFGGTCGALYGYYNSGAIPRSIASRRGVFKEYDGEFRSTANSLAICVGSRFMDIMYLGGVIRFANETIDSYDAVNFSGDIGALYEIIDKRLTAGFSASNIGTGMQFIEESTPLPVDIKTGVGYYLTDSDEYLTAIDFSSRDGFHLGFEYKMHLEKEKRVKKMYHKFGSNDNISIKYKTEKIYSRDMLFFRAGCRPGNLSILNVLSAFSFGVGINYYSVGFDYAFVPFGELGNTHNVFLSYRFGLEKERPKIGEEIIEQKLKKF
ncbi:PorV/PorQ family protein [Elusimicrobiota bacterium]